ncbi:MAG: ribonuclease Z [Bacteroidota bacterium]
MTVHCLGTGSAGAGADRTTTMLAVEAAGHTVLVDCGGDAVQRLLASGLDPVALDAVILTHEHPDHLSGYPLLVEKLWLRGRRDPIPAYGPASTLAKARALFAIYETAGWTHVPERVFHEVPLDPGTEVARLGNLVISATPVDHPVPTIGLRFEAGGAVFAYSCDTAPSPHVVALSRSADLLIHEGTASLAGVHSSPEEAAQVAAEAGVGRLVLIHAPETPGPLDGARAIFPEVVWAEDGDRFEVGD